MKLNEDSWISINDDRGRKMESSFIGAFKTLIIRLDGNKFEEAFQKLAKVMKDDS
jgi:hypothetical protein